MARHTGGWFKTWRDAWSKDLSDNLTLWGIWNAFLHMATWKESKILWNGKQRILPPGSVVFGVSELAAKWKCSKSTIWRWVQYLASSERIRYESGTSGCLVTILNWEIYQSQVDAAETLAEQNANTARTRPERGENLSKKEEEKKEDWREDLYGKYPKRKGDQGKDRAFKKLDREFTSQENRTQLEAAVRNYAKHCDAEGKTGTEFVKMFATFVNGVWKEWASYKPPVEPGTINTTPVDLFGEAS